MNLSRFFKPILFVGIVSIFLTACSDDDPDPVPTTANVMVVHASPDAPGVDLLVDDQMVNTSPLTFPNNTGYLAVNSGTRNIKVNAAGTSTSVINADIDFAQDLNYSIFAIDTLSSIEALLLVDDLTAPVAGEAKIRFIHLSPDAPAVDVAPDGGNPLFANQSFRDATGFASLAAGDYNLEVRLAGTTTVALDLPPITLEDGKIYTVFARGLLGNQTLDAEIIVNN